MPLFRSLSSTRVVIPLIVAPVPIMLILVWADAHGTRPLVNMVIASISIGGAVLFGMDVWIYRRRLLRRGLIAIACLLLSGLANAVCACLT